MDPRHPTASNLTPMWRVAVVDDHSFIRAIFATIVEDDPDMELIWTASCLAEARANLHRNVPDLLILDITLPDGTGFELAREILEFLPELRVLIVSSHATKAHAKRAQDCGAKGYLTKSCSPDEIIEAIDVVRGGGTYFRLLQPARSLDVSGNE